MLEFKWPLKFVQKKERVKYVGRNTDKGTEIRRMKSGERRMTGEGRETGKRRRNAKRSRFRSSYLI
jgi:hypothetical protein